MFLLTIPVVQQQYFIPYCVVITHWLFDLILVKSLFTETRISKVDQWDLMLSWCSVGFHQQIQVRTGYGQVTRVSQKSVNKTRFTLYSHWYLTYVNTSLARTQHETSAAPFIEQVCFSPLGVLPPVIPSLTVGSHSDEGSRTEEQDEDNVAAEKEPSQRCQVVEPGGCVSVQRLVEQRFEVGLTPERPNCP